LPFAKEKIKPPNLIVVILHLKLIVETELSV